MFAKVAAPQVYSEKFVKPAMIACANDVLGKDAASTLSTILLSNDTIARRQDELSNFVDKLLRRRWWKLIKRQSSLSRLMRAQFITKLSFWSMSDPSMKVT